MSPLGPPQFLPFLEVFYRTIAPLGRLGSAGFSIPLFSLVLSVALPILACPPERGPGDCFGQTTSSGSLKRCLFLLFGALPNPRSLHLVTVLFFAMIYHGLVPGPPPPL